jgi:hypothetical protein
MMPSLQSIRRVFPDWPSEFDVARQPQNWASLAQDFFCAALIVKGENRRCHAWLHSDAPKPFTDEIAVGLHGQRAAVFCMAFALELTIKAAYVMTNGRKRMKPNCTIDFGSHRIIQLAEDISEGCLTDADKQAIRLAQEIIVNGKYPTTKKPKDNAESFNLPSLEHAIEAMEPVYRIFMGYVTEIKK